MDSAESMVAGIVFREKGLERDAGLDTKVWLCSIVMGIIVMRVR